VELSCDKKRPLCMESLLTEKPQLRIENDGCKPHGLIQSSYLE